MAWIPVVIGVLTGLVVSHQRQTVAVADISADVVPPSGKVSIVIPTLNEESTISRTLDALHNQNIVQTYPEAFEYIVVDSSSTDSTVAVANQYEDVTVIVCGLGKLTAKDAGIRAASGDIVIFVDSDNILKPNLLNLTLRHFQDPNVVAVGANLVQEGLTEPIWTFMNQYWNYLRVLVGNLTAIRRNAYFEVGGYDLTINQQTRREVQFAEEEEFSVRLQKVGQVIIDSQATVFVGRPINPCLFDPTGEYCEQVKNGLRF